MFSGVRLPVSLFWSFLFHDPGFPQIFGGPGHPVMGGSLAGSCVGLRGLSKAGFSERSGGEAPVMTGAHPMCQSGKGFHLWYVHSFQGSF